MQHKTRSGALVTGTIVAAVLLLTPPSEAAQTPRKAHRVKAQQHNKQPHRFALTQANFAMRYSGESAKLAGAAGNHFWLNGGGADGALTVYRGLGLAMDLNVEHAAGISQNIGVNKTTFVFGPRFTRDASKWIGFRKLHQPQIFGEALFGVAHGFDSLFPIGASGSSSSAGSFAFQLGTGVDIQIWKGFGIRALQLDYVRTGFPNGASNSQHDFRLSFGINYRRNRATERKTAGYQRIFAPTDSRRTRKAIARIRKQQQSTASTQ